MLDIGWSEMAILAMVALFVIGPKDLPKVLRTVGRYAAKVRGIAREFQDSIEEAVRDSELDEVRKQIQKASTFDVKKAVVKTIDPRGEIAEALKIDADNKKVAAETVTKSKTTAAEPAAAEPKPETAAAEPAAAEPEPAAAETAAAEPESETAATETAEPEPEETVVKPEPTAAQRPFGGLAAGAFAAAESVKVARAAAAAAEETAKAKPENTGA